MYKFFKKSITRQYVYYLIIVVVAALIGSILLTGINYRIQDKYLEKREELMQKHEIVNAIEDHFMLMVFHARGYFYLQGDEKEEAAVEFQRGKVKDELLDLDKLQLDFDESQFLSEFTTRFTNYEENILKPSMEYVKDENFDDLKKLAVFEGARDEVTELVEKTQEFVKAIDDKLDTVNKNLTTVSQIFSAIYIAYILLILLVVGIVIRKMSKNLGVPLIALTKASEQLVKGQYTNLSFEKREDEIGALSNAFHAMARSIQNKEEELTAQNEELLAQQEDLEEHQARLQASYEETESRRQLSQDIIDNVNEGITLLDVNGSLLQYNHMFLNIVGEETELKVNSGLEQWSQLLEDRVDNFNEFLDFIKTAIRNKGDKVLSYRYEIKSPVNKIYDIYAVTIHKNQFRLGTLIVHRDITAEYEVDQMKSELVSTVSHELRTPLASVLGFAELMLTKELKPERQKKYLETIYKEASRLTNLINDFLDIQRMESGKQTYDKKQVNINEIVRDLMTKFKTTNKQHQFVIELEKDRIETLGDEEKLIQVFTNLISNAVKFSPDGGKVTISIKSDDKDVSIAIKDEGLGIPAEEVSKLFQKFYRIDNSDRRKIGGTGLGLAISKQIVEAHNGVISVFSVQGEGSTFTVKLPAFVATSLNNGSVEPKNSDVPLLIIVEDDESLAMLLSEELKELKLEVKHYSDGESAIAAIRKRQPDLIVLDIMLGIKMDGWAVIEDLKKDVSTKTIPIIISSALDEKERGLNLGIDHYLTKPYPHGKLSEVVLDLLKIGGKTGEILIPVEETEPEEEKG